MNVPPIFSYSQLINRNQSWQPVLGPENLPVHPSIFESDLPFSEAFLRRLIAGMPGALREDIAEIEQVLERETRLTVTDSAIIYTTSHSNPLVLDFNKIFHNANPEKRTIDVRVKRASIALDLERDPRHLDVTAPHPLPLSTLLQCAYETDDYGLPRIHTWFIHNIYDLQVYTQYLRTFAIAFNNLASEVLDKPELLES